MQRTTGTIFWEGLGIEKRRRWPRQSKGEKTKRYDSGSTLPKNATYMLEPCRTPTVYSSFQEKQTFDDVGHFEKKFCSSIVTPVLIESKTIQHIFSQIPSFASMVAGNKVTCDGVDQNAVNVAQIQLQTVTFPSRMGSFLSHQRSSTKKTTQKRPPEKQKASKHQPELVLAHMRNLYHAEALAQIQRHVAWSGTMIPGFNRWHNIIQESISSSHGHSVSSMEHRGEKIFVRPLNEPRQHANASLRFGSNETPVNHDASMLKSNMTFGCIALSSGRASIWTLPSVVTGSREMLASLLLQ